MTKREPVEFQYQKFVDEDAQAIQDEIIRVGNKFRARHPWVEKHQDFIGLAILLGATAITALGAYLIYYELVPYFVGFMIVALSTSIVHEIEHDTIHNLYFNKSIVNDFMLLVCWLVRWNTINPWARRRLHFWHHRASGTEADLEERGITNGEPWSLKRIIMMADGTMAFMLRPVTVIMTSRAYCIAQTQLSKAARIALRIENMTLYLPFGYVHYLCLYSFIVFNFIATTGKDSYVPYRAVLEPWLPLMTNYLWCLGFPTAFRTFLLVLTSSNMHYYGDIKVGEVRKQTQIWSSKWTLPIDIFTFNFGGTHCLHHFSTRDTFYIRQLTAHELYPFCEEHGVRFNDFANIFRANRWSTKYNPNDFVHNARSS